MESLLKREFFLRKTIFSIYSQKPTCTEKSIDNYFFSLPSFFHIAMVLLYLKSTVDGDSSDIIF